MPKEGCNTAASPVHVGHVHYVSNVASVRLILTFVILLISPTGSAGSEWDKYNSKDKEPSYNSMHKRC